MYSTYLYSQTTVDRPPSSCGVNTERNSFPNIPSGQGRTAVSTLTGDGRSEAFISFQYSYARSSRSNRQLSSCTSGASRELQPNSRRFAYKSKSPHMASDHRPVASCHPTRLDHLFNSRGIASLSPSFLCQLTSSTTNIGTCRQTTPNKPNEWQSQLFERTLKHSLTLKSPNRRNHRSCGSCFYSANKPNIIQTLNPSVQSCF